MNLINSVIFKLIDSRERLPIKLFFWLFLGAFLSGISLTLFEIYTLSLFFSDGGSYRLAFDLIISAFIMVLTGRIVLMARRRKGIAVQWGCWFLFSVLLLAFFGSILEIRGCIDILFIGRYALWSVFMIAFWSVASRKIPLKMDSLKCVIICCIQLIGIMTAGWVGYIYPISSVFGVCVAFLGLFLFLPTLYVMTRLMPVQDEAFIHRGGGAKEEQARYLTNAVVFTALLVMVVKCISDYVFWVFFWSYSEPEKLTSALNVFWGIFGTLGFLMLFFLYRTRYLYTTRSGLFTFLLSVFALGVGADFKNTNLVLGAYTLFYLTFFLYVGQYLTLLPEILKPGRGVRLKTLRSLVAEPIGFLIGALLIFFFPGIYMQSSILICLGIILSGVFWYSTRLYSDLLLNSFRLRLWRGNVLMIMSSRLFRYIQETLKRENADDTIYFLKILEYARHPKWKKMLLKSLRHKSPKVRIFVLRRLSRLINVHDFYKTIERAYEKENHPHVRHTALSLLIELSSKRSDMDVQSFAGLLNNRRDNKGALIGFLNAGDNSALLAMEGLQRLIASKHRHAHLKALDIMIQAPLSGLVRVVIPFLKSSDIEIVSKALVCAGEMRHPALLPDIFKAVTDERLSDIALTALEKYGKRAFPPIEKILHQSSGNALLQKRLILFLSMIKSGEGKQILIRALNSPIPELRRDVLKALSDTGIVWVQKDKKMHLIKAFKNDVNRVLFLTDLIRKFTLISDPDTVEALTSLKSAFIKDIMVVRDIILYQLMFFKDVDLMHQACRILMTNSSNSSALTAIGVIQDLIPKRLYQMLLPVLTFDVCIFQTNSFENTLSKEEIVHILSELILNPPFVLNDWEKTLIFHTLRCFKDKAAMPAIQVGLNESDVYVLEAVIFALIRLESDKKRVRELLLNVPTSRLVGQTLEKISNEL